MKHLLFMDRFMNEFIAPTGILNSDEQLNLVYTIAGANPLGSPIFTIATPRIRMLYVLL